MSYLSAAGKPLCIEFTNTTSARDTATPNERLHSYADLLAWGDTVGVLSDETAAALRAAAAAQPDEAARVVQDAVELREVIYRLFVAQMDGQAPEAADLVRFNAAHAEAARHLHLCAGEDGYRWVWEASAGELDQMLWPALRSAAELLTAGERVRVSQCAGEHCTWLFVDRSKNHSRRWCDMQECGNVAKVRRYRSRRKAERGESSEE